MPGARLRQRANARERRAITEKAILEAAEELLAERSFRDLSVEDVMAAAGLTRTAFYRYFPDLDTVLLRLLFSVEGELRTAAQKWLDPDADPLKGLLTAATGLAEVYQEHGRLLLAIDDAAAGSPEIEAAWHEAIQSFVAPVRIRIEGLKRDGLCSVDEPGQVAVALVWMNERYLLATFGRGQKVTVAVAAQTIATIWRRSLFAPMSSLL